MALRHVRIRTQVPALEFAAEATFSRETCDQICLGRARFAKRRKKPRARGSERSNGTRILQDRRCDVLFFKASVIREISISSHNRPVRFGTRTAEHC